MNARTRYANRPAASRETVWTILAGIAIGAVLAGLTLLGDRMSEHGPLFGAQDTVTTVQVATVAHPVELSEQEAERVSYCTDGLPVYVDTDTGVIYGDQNRDGVLAGTDCDWT